MIPLKIRIYGDPCLREKAKPVEEIGPSERILLDSMIHTMHEAKGIGLAAPQVGIVQRIFVMDVGEGPIAVINPEIIGDQGSAVMEEGCLSIPEVNIEIERAHKIQVTYRDENNKLQERFFEDLLARVFQHEKDHLDGKLIVDYATPEDLEKCEPVLKKLEEESK